VIATAATIDSGGHAGGLEQGDGLFGERGIAGRGVLQSKKLVGKAAEIVNGLRRRIAGEQRDRGLPMRRCDQHRAGTRQLAPERGPRATRGARLDRVHWRAV
jgi:hypothetical protein